MSEARRRGIERALKLLTWMGIFGVLFVFADFAVDFRPRSIQDSYRFRLPELVTDQPQILQRDQLRILVIQRSEGLQQRLLQITELQDAESKRSSQPEDAENPLRAKDPDFFVALALGTDFQCPLIIDAELLRESCSDATYDFAGRAQPANRRFDNLVVPDYSFSDDGSHLIVYP